MSEFGFWDLFLWSVAAYMAVVVLVRMMRRSREQLLVQLQKQVAAERARKAAEERKRKREEVRLQQLEEFQKRRDSLQSQLSQRTESTASPRPAETDSEKAPVAGK